MLPSISHNAWKFLMKKRHIILVEISFDVLAPESRAVDFLDRLLRHPAAVQSDIDSAAAADGGSKVVAYQIVASTAGSRPKVAASQRVGAS